MADRACDTCRHLAVPEDADHAKHYRVCKAITPLPANMHVSHRAEMEGREEGSRRWITVKIVEELKHMLRDCELHSPAIDTRTIAENYPTAKCNECEWQGPRDQLMSGASPLDELCPRCTSEDTEWVEAK